MRPSGTVTFLFSDIEGSTRLWESQPERMPAAFARQEHILRSGIAAHDGYAYKMIGDAFQAAFAIPIQALRAAIAIQRELEAQAWGETPIRVRMALHVGVTEERGDDYVGPVLNRVARLLAAGHGGQILLSQAAAELIHDQLPSGVTLEDKGVHPLKDLTRPEHIYQVHAPGLAANFPALKLMGAQPNNLPLQLTSFIGRDKEMSALNALLARPDTRLVTLTGPGGTGKTRLSLQIASEMLAQFSEGAWFVELASVTDPALVVKMVASVLDVRESPDRTLLQSLSTFIRAKKILIILDNCEHLVDACAALADGLLRTCPNLKILASSREIFGIGGEIPFRVPSLGMPDTQNTQSLDRLGSSESVRLFVERAQATSSTFALTEQNAADVVQIVKRLDGIPLAIELAAARVRLLNPAQIAARLDDAFRLLTGGSRAVLPRHQTLRALIDWSYDLLSPRERTLLRRLSVFSGTWTLEAAESVCAQAGADTLPPEEVLDLLALLVDKSLVFCYETNADAVHYRMMETIRQYAHEKLVDHQESEAVRASHLAYYLKLAESSEPFLRSREQVASLNRLEYAVENLRQALEWALEKDFPAELRLSSALMWYWHIRGQAMEGVEWLRKGLEKLGPAGPDDPKALRARALMAMGALISEHGNPRASIPILQESLDIYLAIGPEDRPEVAYTYRWLAAGAGRSREKGSADGWLERAIQLFQASNDRFGLSECLLLVAYRIDHPQEAEAAYLRVLDLKQEIGDLDGIAFTLQWLGNLAFKDGNYSKALAWLDESLRLFREVGNRHYTAADLHTKATIYWASGDYPQALAWIDEALAASRDSGDQRQHLQSLIRKGEITITHGDNTVAESSFCAALQLANETNDQRSLGFALLGLGKVDFLAGRRTLAQERWQKAQAVGQAVHFRPVILEGLVLRVKSALWQGDGAGAAALLSENAAAAPAFGERGHPNYPPDLLASLALQQKAFEKAARLFGASDPPYHLIQHTLLPLERQQRALDMAQLQAELGAQRWQRCLAEGASLSAEQIQQLYFQPS
jgi:predicted ATPase/class 3 adenylate cyclase